MKQEIAASLDEALEIIREGYSDELKLRLAQVLLERAQEDLEKAEQLSAKVFENRAEE